MKLAERKSHNEIETPNEIKSFNFTLNAKAYKVFTDSIYKNKILAVIRELTTNAIDSQKEAGNSTSYEVHLPEYQEEYFSIRDYGTGLSESQIEKIYTNFFFSTKENSNDFNGLFGLGSKAPLCYNTKSFTIESFYSGKKYVYLCFLNDDEIPSYTKVSEEESNELPGLKIQFAVNSGDIPAFAKEAERFYKFVELQPKINEVFTPLEKVYENEHFFVSKQAESGILMGNVLYPLEMGHEALREYEDIIKAKIVIPIPNGSIEFSVSRESLSYNSQTVAFLRKKFKDIISYFQVEIEKQISGCTTLFQAQIKYSEVLEDFVYFPVRSFCKTALFQGQPISLNLTFSKPITYYSKERYRKKVGVHGTKQLRIHHKDFFVYKDCKNAGGRIAEFISIKNSNIDYKAHRPVAYVFTDESLVEANIDKSDIILASSLPKPSALYVREKIGGLCQWKNNSRITYSWLQVDDYEEDAYYVIKKNGYILLNNETLHPQKIAQLALSKPVYGINKSQEKEAIKNGLVSLDKHVQELFGKQKRILDKNRDTLVKYITYNYIDWRLTYSINKYHNEYIQFSEIKISDPVYNIYLEYEKKKEIWDKILQRVRPYLDFYTQNLDIDHTLKNSINDQISKIKLPTYRELLEKYYENSI